MYKQNPESNIIFQRTKGLGMAFKGLIENILKEAFKGTNESTRVPRIAITLGSGLARAMEQSEYFTILGELPQKDLAFHELPDFTVDGHELRILIVRENVSKKLIIVTCGRKHLYETTLQTRHEVLTIPRALAFAGVRDFFHTSAVGGIHPTEPGSMILVTDHLGLEIVGAMELFTHSSSAGFGPAFFACTHMYTKKVSEKTYKGMAYRGMLQFYRGTNFENEAQIRLLEANEVAGVGMSMLPETMGLVQMRQNESGEFKDIRNFGIAVVANPAAGKGTVLISDDDVKKEMQKAGPELLKLISKIINDDI